MSVLAQSAKGAKCKSLAQRDLLGEKHVNPFQVVAWPSRIFDFDTGSVGPLERNISVLFWWVGIALVLQ